MLWMHQYVAKRNVFRNCLKMFPPITGLRRLYPTDQPHRMPVGHRSSVGGAVRPGAVGWRIGDVAALRHLRLVGTIPRGTEALDRAGSMTPSLYTTRWATSSQCSSVWMSRGKPLLEVNSTICDGVAVMELRYFWWIPEVNLLLQTAELRPKTTLAFCILSIVRCDGW